MTRVWMFAARVALAASYLTLAIADESTAAELAGPYAGLVVVVAVVDFLRARAAGHASD